MNSLSYQKARPTVSSKRILLIEYNQYDARMVQREFKKIAKKEKIHIDWVQSLSAGIQRLHTYNYSTIITNLSLSSEAAKPNLNNLNTLLSYHKGIPIIVVSNVQDDALAQQALAQGAQDYLVKGNYNNHQLWRSILFATKRHNLRRNLEEQAQKLQISNQNLSKQNETQNKLICTTSHDLRSPLHGILGVIELIKEENPSPSTKKHLDAISSTAQSMIALVEDLLEFSSIGSGNYNIKLQPYPLSYFIQHLITFLKESGSKKNIDIVFEPNNQAQEICFDYELIKRVVFNLVNNAIKFSPPHSTVHIRIAVEAKYFTVYVEDEGPGIQEDEQHKLFQEYGVTSNKPTGQEKSTGLGLFICHTIIEAHNGLIGMSNRSPKGSSFFFSLPQSQHASARATLSA